MVKTNLRFVVSLANSALLAAIYASIRPFLSHVSDSAEGLCRGLKSMLNAFSLRLARIFIGGLLLICGIPAQSAATLQFEMEFTEGSFRSPLFTMLVAVHDGRVVTFMQEQPQQITVYNSKTGRFTSILLDQQQYFHSAVYTSPSGEIQTPPVQWQKTQNTGTIAGFECQWHELITEQEKQQVCLASEAVFSLSGEDATTLRSLSAASEAFTIDKNQEARRRGGIPKASLTAPPKNHMALAYKSESSYGQFSSELTQMNKTAGKSIVLSKEIIPRHFNEFVLTEAVE